MLNKIRTFRHLSAEEFINLLDGIPLAEPRVGHVATCAACRTTLTSMTLLREDILDAEDSDSEAADAAVANADWLELRSGVRDRLLARSVKRSSVLQRWTGWTLMPAASWSLALMILVSGMTAGGLWHYQTAHLATRTNDTNGTAGISPTNGIDFSVTDSGLESGLFLEESAASEAEALAWSRSEIFTTLNELELDEEEALRELITIAFSEDSIFDSSVQ